MIARQLKLSLTILLIAVLCACGASPYIQAPPLAQTTIVGEQQGYLVARIINAGNVPLPFNYLYISPNNLNESTEVKSTQLAAINPASGESPIYVSAVDAGQYSLSSISSFHSNGNYWYSHGVRADIELGTFEIVPGKVTDLGTLVYYPRNQGERYIETLMRSPGNENPRLVEAILPFFSYKSDESLSWKEDEYDDNRRASYNSALQNPVVFNKRYLAPDGSLYVIGKLGTVLVRKPDGQWSIDAVDTDSELSSIVQNSRGDIALAGEYGSLFLKKLGQPWSRIDIDPAYSVEELIFLDDSTLDIIIKGVYDFKIMRGNIDTDNPNWNLITRYEPKSGWLDSAGAPTWIAMTRSETDRTPRLMSYAKIFQRGDQRHLFMGVQIGQKYHTFAQRRHKHLIVNPEDWSMATIKGFEDGIDRILEAGATQLAIKKSGFWSWDGRDTYLRYDNKTSEWREVTTRIARCKDGEDLVYKAGCSSDVTVKNKYLPFSFRSVPIYFSENEALAFVNIPRLDKNKEEKSIYVLETKDGGEAWSMSDKKPPSKFCTRTVPEITDVLLVNCEGISSDFYTSKDRGETWEHVREHESF